MKDAPSGQKQQTIYFHIPLLTKQERRVIRRTQQHTATRTHTHRCNSKAGKLLQPLSSRYSLVFCVIDHVAPYVSPHENGNLLPTTQTSRYNNKYGIQLIKKLSNTLFREIANAVHHRRCAVRRGGTRKVVKKNCWDLHRH